ncbi:right-handed parallel beta-helix repeat-containing protein [Paenibacillus sp. MWE-103]|uniref:Right-handed parallel beta-helix repeat-containing protein n=1 Tax=Paenibacillus artemisiicola TaxID=1172618 RepID=A0ABS3W333_9BACL|nr:right-handed parallel beta-helix repeat-containing protein [Paenibacillus artemisiicola]MBO7742712.1 right-handed parallel beta-helix repeat-containing protein [Paenibacillus artemisiicola]
MIRESMLSGTGRTITVGGPGAEVQGFSSAAVQAAVEELRRGGEGGTILLDEGEYRATGPIRLYGGMTLQGRGPNTVLKKSGGVKTRFVTDADYGELQAEVEDPSGFEPGTGLQLFDDKQKWGWDESTAVVTRVEGRMLYFDRHLERDYIADHGGTVTNACSVIEVRDARHVRILDLTVDGSGERNEPIGGCRAGGIYLYKAGDCRIENVAVRNFNGDGISWQITEHVEVRRCAVTDCAGSGLHPGAGTARTVVADCRLEGNGLAGLFICWRVRYGEFVRNRMNGNGSCGISIGHKDSYNLFADNEIRGNGECGVDFREEKPGNGANGNRWLRNAIADNGGEDGEGCGIVVRGAAADNVFIGNAIDGAADAKPAAATAAAGGATEARMTGEQAAAAPQGRQRTAVRLGEGAARFTFE